MDLVVCFGKNNSRYFFKISKNFTLNFRRELQTEQRECLWPRNERGCVTLWAIRTILSSGPEENEFQLIPSLGEKLRMAKQSTKLPIEVQLK